MNGYIYLTGEVESGAHIGYRKNGIPYGVDYVKVAFCFKLAVAFYAIRGIIIYTRGDSENVF